MPGSTCSRINYLDRDTPHLPRCHFSEVAHVGVPILLNRKHRGFRAKPDRRLKAFFGRSPKAWRQGKVSRFIVLVLLNVSLPVDRELTAEQLRCARVILIEFNRDASRCVAVATGVDHHCVRHGPVILNLVHTFAVGTVRAVSGARRPWRGLTDGPIIVSEHRIAWN